MCGIREMHGLVKNKLGPSFTFQLYVRNTHYILADVQQWQHADDKIMSIE